LNSPTGQKISKNTLILYFDNLGYFFPNSLIKPSILGGTYISLSL